MQSIKPAFDPDLTSRGVLERASQQYGPYKPLSLPAADQVGFTATPFESLHQAARGEKTVLFTDIAVSDLDRFFYLRLIQILKREPAFPALSVIVLRPDQGERQLAGGFGKRFLNTWPFERCVFLTGSRNTASMSDRLGLQVASLRDAAEPLRSRTTGNQKIALQLQRIWGCRGGTTIFENQVESLVAAGFFTIRVFTDAIQRRGATLDHRMGQIIAENTHNAGAHINVVAVPDGPPIVIRAKNPDQTWATWLAATATCRIREPMMIEAAQRAEAVIANELETVGPAVAIAPQGRLMIQMLADRARTTRELLRAAGKSDAEILMGEAAASRVQARVMAIPDICVHVNQSEYERLANQSRLGAALVPRPYVTKRSASTPVPTRFDVLIFGDDHALNAASLRWFLDEVWQPFLEPASVSLAIAGRVGNQIQDRERGSPGLHVLGHVEDLEAVREISRLTVVPDRHETGIAVKTLATMGSGHPLVVTPAGLRGLGRPVMELLPAEIDPRRFASDILALLSDPARLLERARLVEKAQAMIRRGPDHAALLSSTTDPTPALIAERQTLWARLIAGAATSGPEPCFFELEKLFPMSGCAGDQEVLVDGWHAPEAWGRWTDGTEALLRINLRAPAIEPLTLEMTLVPSLARADLRLTFEDVEMPPVGPTNGPVQWPIPSYVTRGKSNFLVKLRASTAMCPARSGVATDDRILGVGLRTVRLLPRIPAVYGPGKHHSNSYHPVPAGALLTGWHEPEEWGCWTAGTTAALELPIARASQRPEKSRLVLELNLVPSPVRGKLSLSVNGRTLSEILPFEGVNQWLLPEDLASDDTCLLIRLSTSNAYRATANEGLSDGRALGIGLRGAFVFEVANEPGLHGAG